MDRTEYGFTSVSKVQFKATRLVNGKPAGAFGTKKPKTPPRKGGTKFTVYRRESDVIIPSATIGYGVGLTGGAIAGVTATKKAREQRVTQKKIQSNTGRLSANTRAINARQRQLANQAIGKAFGFKAPKKGLSQNTHLITDLGSKQHKVKPNKTRRVGTLRPAGVGAVGLAAGSAIGFTATDRAVKNELPRAKTRLANQDKKLAEQHARRKELGISKGIYEPFFKAEASARRKNIEGSAAVGAGTVVAGAGYLAGGLPGTKTDVRHMKDIGHNYKGNGVKRAAQSARRDAKTVGSTAGGGIFGFRIANHKAGEYAFKENDKVRFQGPPKTKTEAFYRGHNAGKLKPEKQVIRTMSRARKASHGALLGGVGIAAYGARRKKQASDDVQKNDARRKSDSRYATALGAGATGAVGTAAVGRVLDNQANKHTWKAVGDIAESGLKVPGMGEFRDGSFRPKVTDGAPGRDSSKLNGATKKQAYKAGKLRGSAGQHRHFAEAYSGTSKWVKRFRGPSAAVAAVGAGGLALNSRKKKDPVQKSAGTMSAFGVEH
mgnify:CR=1 FL=1